MMKTRFWRLGRAITIKCLNWFKWIWTMPPKNLMIRIFIQYLREWFRHLLFIFVIFFSSVIREFQTLPFAHCIIRYKLNWKSEHSTHLKVEHLKLGDGWLLTVESMKDYMIINGCNLKTVELTDNVNWNYQNYNYYFKN